MSDENLYADNGDLYADDSDYTGEDPKQDLAFDQWKSAFRAKKSLRRAEEGLSSEELPRLEESIENYQSAISMREKYLQSPEAIKDFFKSKKEKELQTWRTGLAQARMEYKKINSRENFAGLKAATSELVEKKKKEREELSAKAYGTSEQGIRDRQMNWIRENKPELLRKPEASKGTNRIG